MSKLELCAKKDDPTILDSLDFETAKKQMRMVCRYSLMLKNITVSKCSKLCWILAIIRLITHVS